MLNQKPIGWLLLLLLLLTACAKQPAAPMVNGWKTAQGKSQLYTIQKKDTLYSIAWMYDLDYQKLAAVNHLHAPYTLQPGQRLRMANSGVSAPSTKQTVQRSPVRVAARSSSVSSSRASWLWPTQGKVIHRFNLIKKQKGIDIAGTKNQAVRSVKAGVVVYSGSGLRGYGRLLIIKHNTKFLSAYAYNQKLLVKEGDRIRRGQRIALMGGNQSKKQPMLHFELRRYGKPVDPLKYLKA